MKNDDTRTCGKNREQKNRRRSRIMDAAIRARQRHLEAILTNGLEAVMEEDKNSIPTALEKQGVPNPYRNFPNLKRGPKGPDPVGEGFRFTDKDSYENIQSFLDKLGIKETSDGENGDGLQERAVPTWANEPYAFIFNKPLLVWLREVILKNTDGGPTNKP